MMKTILCTLSLAVFLMACSSTRKSTAEHSTQNNKEFKANPKAKTFTKALPINRNEFVRYAKTMLGIPYQYGSSQPAKGLDCSGFVYHVFAHFNVKSPRVSKDFTNEGQTVSEKNARIGDIILFTGSNHVSGIVGHMGIITSVAPKLQFIHSASGKNIGVILNDLSGYYRKHFVKIISVLQ